MVQKRPQKRFRTATAPKIDENRILRRFRTHFSGPGCDFRRFWGPRWKQNSSKMRSKKQLQKMLKQNRWDVQRCTNMCWVGVMCWASREVRRGHTSYDSLRTGSRTESRSTQLKLFSMLQDLLLRAADFNAYGTCRTTSI